jgi:hypothetical protein
MKYLHFPNELENSPIRLTQEELQKPTGVIEEFFRFYNLNHTRLELGSWLEYALGSDDEDMEKGNKRVNLMQFSYQLEALIEAVYIMHFDGQLEKKKE